MDIKDLQEKIYNVNTENGWHENDPNMATKEEFFRFISNCHSEISEAFEEFKNNCGELYSNGEKPEGIFAELADVIIYILDFAQARNIDLGEIILKKTEFNASRGYRHGNKQA